MAGSTGSTNWSAVSLGTTVVQTVSLGSTVLWSTDSTAISLENVGPGTTRDFPSNTSGSTTSYNHPGATKCVIAVLGGYRTSTSIPTWSVTYGGNAMTAIGSIIWGNGDNGGNASFVQWFGLMNPPTGSQAVVASYTSAGFLSPYVTLNTASWLNVNSWSGPTSVTGTETGTALAQTVSSATGRVVMQMFMHEPLGSATPIGDYDGNQLWIVNGGDNGQGVVGYKAGSSSVNFSASRTTGADYQGSAIQLIPA